MRRFLSMAAFLCLLIPGTAFAQQGEFQGNCTHMTQTVQPLADNIARMDRAIGTSSGNAKQRKSLYETYDALAVSYSSLEKAMFNHQSNQQCTVRLNEFVPALDAMDKNLKAWYSAVDGKNGLSKEEYNKKHKPRFYIENSLIQLLF